MQCSVSDFEKSKEMIDGIVKKYGRLDILVNNAGITKDNLIMKMSEDDFDAVIATNLKGAFNCIKHVSRQMLKQRGGRIINISSVSGVMGNAGQANSRNLLQESLEAVGSQQTQSHRDLSVQR